MKKSNVSLKVVLPGVILISLAANSSAAEYEILLTEWGYPDLRGLYNFGSNTPIQRPSEHEGRELLTPEEVIARDQAIIEFSAANDGIRDYGSGVGGIGKDGPEDRGLSERCLVGFNAGPPFMPSMYNNNVQIFQNEDHVVIFNEMIHHARIVPSLGLALRKEK